MANDEPLISVAVPARNGRRRLERTLESIARSSVDVERIEVVVADDGSEDGTHESLSRRTYPFRFEIRRGQWSSQSAATNEAIRHCTGALVLLSAQDILFHEDLIAEHLKRHREFPEEEVAVVGRLAYPEQLPVTPFLFYLVNGGLQFAYYLIKDPLRVPPNFVYAPNFSARRSTLERVGLFDEQLPYGCQDTDLGIRLARTGVRITYNERALGYHDHPTDLHAFCLRQEKVAAGKIRLHRKHPDHEDELPCWDVVVSNFLGHSRVRHDLDMEQIAELEREIDGRPDYRALWVRGWVQGEDPGRFTDGERETLRVVDRLFNAYTRTLQFHWAKGYLEEALRTLGVDRVREVLEARLSKLQASAQTHRLIGKRLAQYDIGPPNHLPAAFVGTRIVHGIDGYADAVRIVEPYQWPRAAAFALQLLLVVERDRLSPEELARLDDAVETVPCRTIEEGVAEALRRARAEIVTICSAGVAFDEGGTTALARAVFERVSDVVVLGGGVLDAESGMVRCGYRLRDRARNRAEPLLRPRGDAGGPQPVDAANAEYLVLRRSALAQLPYEDLEGVEWNVGLCRHLSRQGGKILHLPQFVAATTAPSPDVRASVGAPA